MIHWTQSSLLIKIRFLASLVLVFFTLTHFMNHALGIFSLEIMEQGRLIFLKFWRNPVLQFLFPIALFFHAQSAIWRLMFRQTWRFSLRERIKIISGLLIPLFLLLHISATRMQWWINGYDDNYAFYLYHHFRGFGLYFLLSMSLLIWVHAYIGLTDVLALRPWYERWRARIAVLYVAFPLLGLAGLASAFGQVNRLAQNPQWLNKVVKSYGAEAASVMPSIMQTYYLSLLALGLFICILLVSRLFYLKRQKQKAHIKITYAGGPKISVPAGITLLEASLANKIEHAHVCGGSGRCSTCRLRVIAGAENLSHPDSSEKSLLEKIHAGHDVRLACQAKISGDTTVALLVGVSRGQTATSGNLAHVSKKLQSNGTEREVVIFFSDLRGFTTFSEKKLPYDVVFVLNQYFRSMGKILEQHNGFIDKFIGDGIMAIFGLNEPIDKAARDAIDASLQMHNQLQNINAALKDEMPEPLELRIGLHAGHAIIGEMGFGRAMQITAIGDVVNTASRLEHANKKLGTWILLSEAVARYARADTGKFSFQTKIQLRGKNHVLQVFGIPLGDSTIQPELKII